MDTSLSPESPRTSPLESGPLRQRADLTVGVDGPWHGSLLQAGWNMDTWASRPEHFTWAGARVGLEGGWAVGLGSPYQGLPKVSYMSGEHFCPSLQDWFSFS